MADPYFSEIKYLGGRTLDFIEVAVDAGTDVSNLVVTIYLENGAIRSSNALAGLSHTTEYGKDIYVIENGAPGSFTGLAKQNGLALSEGGTVYQFVSFDDTAGTVTATEGPAAGMTSEDVGQAGGGHSLESSDGGQSYGVQASPNAGSIPCLVAGTRVETRAGPVAVEDLRPGMELRTAEGRYVPLRLSLSRAVRRAEIRANPRLMPVRIAAHALGQGLPQRDLLVSRQHRMLVQTPIVRRMCGQGSALVPR